MKIITLVATVLAATLSLSALAAPSVVSDATTVTAVTHCAWYVDSTARQLVVAPKLSGQPYCMIDIQDIAVGTHTVKAAFVVSTSGFEEEGPQSLPFTFTRPAKPIASPSGLRIQP